MLLNLNNRNRSKRSTNMLASFISFTVDNSPQRLHSIILFAKLVELTLLKINENVSVPAKKLNNTCKVEQIHERDCCSLLLMFMLI